MAVAISHSHFSLVFTSWSKRSPRITAVPNQTNAVFIRGLQEKTRYNFVIYSIQINYTIHPQRKSVKHLSVLHSIYKWFIIMARQRFKKCDFD